MPAQEADLPAPTQEPCLCPAGAATAFVERMSVAIPAPLIETPRLRAPRRRRHQVVKLRRSSRLAVKTCSRLPKPELQAQSVLLKKWGLQEQAADLDHDSIVHYKAIFNEPLSPSKREALDVLFSNDAFNGPTLLEASA